MPLTLEQQRIQVAYDATRAYLQAQPGPANKKNWKTAVMSFGSEVQRCGLLQAIAFLARDESEEVAGKIQGTMRDHLIQRGMLASDAHANLLQAVSALDVLDYMLVTREVLALALWFRRSAQALCGRD